MQGLSEAPPTVFGEDDQLDNLEMAADPSGGDPFRKRFTQPIGPGLAALPDVPPGVSRHDVVLLGQCQPVTRPPGVLLEEVPVPRLVVREVITPHAMVTGPHVGREDQSRCAAHQTGNCGGPVTHGRQPTMTRRFTDALGEVPGGALIRP